jgi:hypothetical protein
MKIYVYLIKVNQWVDLIYSLIRAQSQFFSDVSYRVHYFQGFSYIRKAPPQDCVEYQTSIFSTALFGVMDVISIVKCDIM